MPLQRDAAVDALVLGPLLFGAILLREPAGQGAAVAGCGCGAGGRVAGRGRAAGELARREVAARPTRHEDAVGIGITAGIDKARQNAERIIGKGIADQRAERRHDMAGAVLKRARGADSGAEAGVVERLGELDVDGRADRTGRQRDVRRLQDANAANEVRTDGAEVDLATAGRGRDAATVIQRRVEVAAKAANRDAGRLTACTGPLDRDAGQALERCRDVRIGKFANVFRRDRVDDTGRGALDVEVALQGAAQAGDDDVGGRRLAGGRRAVIGFAGCGGLILRGSGLLGGGGVGLDRYVRADRAAGLGEGRPRRHHGKGHERRDARHQGPARNECSHKSRASHHLPLSYVYHIHARSTFLRRTTHSMTRC